MPQTTNTAGPLRNLFTAILLTWLVAGTLDGLAAIIHYSAKGGKDPAIIFKYIASGVFGKKAFTGGTAMVLWGVFFHYLIALGLTVFFYAIYPTIKWLGQHVIIAGILYGIFAWLVTTQLIVRFISKIKAAPVDPAKAVIPVLILVVCIGLPISIMANKHYLYKK